MTKIELWRSTVSLKHIPIDDTSPASLQASMNAIADAVDAAPPFKDFNTTNFRSFVGDDPCPLLNRLFDFADDHLIHVI